MDDVQKAGIPKQVFDFILAVAIIAAFIMTLEGVDTRHAGNVTQPGTIGLAKPHPPLDSARERSASPIPG